jgi:hypothetical protein
MLASSSVADLDLECMTRQGASSSSSLPMRWQRVHCAASATPSTVFQVAAWSSPYPTLCSVVPAHPGLRAMVVSGVGMACGVVIWPFIMIL